MVSASDVAGLSLAFSFGFDRVRNLISFSCSLHVSSTRRCLLSNAFSRSCEACRQASKSLSLSSASLSSSSASVRSLSKMIIFLFEILCYPLCVKEPKKILVNIGANIKMVHLRTYASFALSRF